MDKLKNNKTLVKVGAIGLFVLTLFVLPFLFKPSEDKLKAASKKSEEVQTGSCDISIRVSGQKEPIPLEEYVEIGRASCRERV